MAYTLDQLFEFQGWIEEAARTAAVRRGVLQSEDSFFISRDSKAEVTPRIAFHFVNGGVTGRQQANANIALFKNSGMKPAFNTYNGILKTTATTNRSDVERGFHIQLVGRMRATFQYFVLAGKPGGAALWTSQVLALTDIFEEDCEDNFEEEADLDETSISWGVVFNIKDSAWPPSF